MNVTCTECAAPVAVDGFRIAVHPEQILTAKGWQDGYDRCPASENVLTPAQQRELLVEELTRERFGDLP